MPDLDLRAIGELIAYIGSLALAVGVMKGQLAHVQEKATATQKRLDTLETESTARAISHERERADLIRSYERERSDMIGEYLQKLSEITNRLTAVEVAAEHADNNTSRRLNELGISVTGLAEKIDNLVKLALKSS